MKVCQATSGGRGDEKAREEGEKNVLLQSYGKPAVAILCEM